MQYSWRLCTVTQAESSYDRLTMLSDEPVNLQLNFVKKAQCLIDGNRKNTKSRHTKTDV